MEALNYYLRSVEKLQIRIIRPVDNKELADIVRNSLAEFGANRQGTVYYDPTTDHLYELFRADRSIYYVAEINEAIVGGAGIFPSPGLKKDTCELVKMYLRPNARGKGLGRQLISKCLEFAKANAFSHVYIETMPELKKAMGIYEKFGFYYLDGPLGNTGHFGCDVWMLKDLD
ncbi:MAG TPA: GNAT family N-acetyltransferase [Puia sp.]|nr:GNAT family N-acetyltransferase [Puia sp.]